MTSYEQLEFEETRNFGHCETYKESKLKCVDNNGNEIKVGDYVVAVSGEAKTNNFEGIVTDIFSDYERCEIMVSTYGGRILERRANPLYYELVK
ncbi:MAG: hypothetical protein J6C46_11295 [Clostridia bacterium]|nr:hypothetical protein [Clostridia bacterium]